MSTVEAAQAIHRHFQQEPPQPQKHLCQDIRLANDIQPRNKISIKKKSQQQKRIESAQRLAEAANVIVQLQKSHMERLEHYLASNPWQELQIEIVGTLAVKAISFVFCVVKDTGSSDSKDTQKALLDFAQRLETTYYIQQVLQRCLLLPQTGKHGLVLIRESNNMVDTVIGIFQQHCQEPTTASDMTKVRIASYPTNLIAPFLKEMEARWQNLPFDKRIVFEPQQASVTHVLSLIELVPPPATAAAGQGLYVVSLEKVRPILVPSTRPLTTHISTENKDQPQQMEICRAYWKLQEAFERYRDGMTKLDSSAVLLPPNCFITDEKNQLVGLDVGASPGGWTQFLIDECCCQTVYSIDPGALHQDLLNRTKKHVVKGENENDEVSVDNFSNKKQGQCIVQHLQTIFQKALPTIAGQRDGKPVDYYVSDMCVKDLSAQIDALLLADSLGLLRKSNATASTAGTFVVLTLKCTRGHSKATFDHLVEEQAKRIADRLEHMQILHLFYNRKSERTILGFWK